MSGRQTVDATSGKITGVQEERQVLIFRLRAHRRTTSCHSHSSWRGLARQGEEIRESPRAFLQTVARDAVEASLPRQMAA